ncbi:calponin [Penaeus vannamei]|uniref:Calponin n=1 Tax=Penaeus vannamei TaxID=6689 RepID=A0A3R7STN7_PENVA|nr:calponin [Penaeus vannamei]
MPRSFQSSTRARILGSHRLSNNNSLPPSISPYFNFPLFSVNTVHSNLIPLPSNHCFPSTAMRFLNPHSTLPSFRLRPLSMLRTPTTTSQSFDRLLLHLFSTILHSNLLPPPTTPACQTYQHPEWPGPWLGPRPAEEHHPEFNEEAIIAGKATIGLQAGSNKGATQAGDNTGAARRVILGK